MTGQTCISNPGRHQKDAAGNMLVASSTEMQAVLVVIDKFAATDLNVLIEGESGTGKGLIARVIQARSPRRHKPFIKVSCAAIPSTLLESELFGYEKGAFTGAIDRKPGKFEIANTGTIFLDEIGDMPSPLQAKLLQVLQEGKFSRLGGTNETHVDVRIIASTNCDLETSVETGQFRDDLFYRLNVVHIVLPPLRQRQEDLSLLTEYFLAKYSREYHRTHGPLARETLDLFGQYGWPGNVRELENLIKRLVILGDERALVKTLLHRSHRVSGHTSADDAQERAGTFSLKDAARMAAHKVEKELINEALCHTRWNRKAAAKRLGISYRSLLYKIKVHDLERSDIEG
jgi:two-component system response regulator AtoC